MSVRRARTGHRSKRHSTRAKRVKHTAGHHHASHHGSHHHHTGHHSSHHTTHRHH